MAREPSWRGDGLENRTVGNGRGSIPPRAASTAIKHQTLETVGRSPALEAGAGGSIPPSKLRKFVAVGLITEYLEGKPGGCREQFAKLLGLERGWGSCPLLSAPITE